MRKIILAFTLVSVLSYGQQNPKTTDKGTVINGLIWATCNVDEPGTFADKPESAGKFYQWNRKKAWIETGKNVLEWNISDVLESTWEKVNDPSPAGWHVPTLEELQKLLDREKVTNEWATVNGINGRKLTDKATGNSIFLPAVGYRNSADGTLDGVNDYGSYWSSARDGSYSLAYNFGFHSNNSSWWKYYNYSRLFGFSVRSVAD